MLSLWARRYSALPLFVGDVARATVQLKGPFWAPITLTCRYCNLKLAFRMSKFFWLFSTIKKCKKPFLACRCTKRGGGNSPPTVGHREGSPVSRGRAVRLGVPPFRPTSGLRQSRNSFSVLGRATCWVWKEETTGSASFLFANCASVLASFPGLGPLESLPAKQWGLRDGAQESRGRIRSWGPGPGRSTHG